MTDTTKIIALRIVSSKDTITLQVDKSLLNFTEKDSKPDAIQILAIVLPITAALITLFLTKLLDNWTENKKNKNDILRKNREDKTAILKTLNEIKASLTVSSFQDAELDDYYEWTADRMIGINPFYNLFISCNILFNKEIIELSHSLYYKAERIKQNFSHLEQRHASESIRLAGNMIDDLESIINLISDDLKK